MDKNIVTKLPILPGCWIYQAWELECGHVGSMKIVTDGKTYRPLAERVIHSLDEAKLLNIESHEIIFKAFPKIRNQRRILGSSWIISYELAEE